jgi:hypothetical protein
MDIKEYLFLGLWIPTKCFAAYHDSPAVAKA